MIIWYTDYIDIPLLAKIIIKDLWSVPRTGHKSGGLIGFYLNSNQKNIIGLSGI